MNGYILVEEIPASCSQCRFWFARNDIPHCSVRLGIPALNKITMRERRDNLCPILPAVQSEGQPGRASGEEDERSSQ